MGKSGSFGFLSVGFVCREKPNVPLVRWQKNKKMCVGQKRKNTEVSAKSVGLPVVPFQYGLSLFVCLSKWFTFFVCPSVTIAYNVFGLCVRAGFWSTKLSTSTELELKHKAPSLHVTPPDAKPVLCACAFFILLVSKNTSRLYCPTKKHNHCLM